MYLKKKILTLKIPQLVVFFFFFGFALKFLCPGEKRSLQAKREKITTPKCQTADDIEKFGFHGRFFT